MSGMVNGWMTASVVDTPLIRINRVLRGKAIAWLTNAQRERLKSNEGIQGVYINSMTRVSLHEKFLL